MRSTLHSCCRHETAQAGAVVGPHVTRSVPQAAQITVTAIMPLTGVINYVCHFLLVVLWNRASIYIGFYRAMHFSAKRGIAIACRLSVCPSMTLVNCDHIGWNSSKIIPPLVSLGRSLFATPTGRLCSKGNTPKFGHKVIHPLLI